MQCVAALLFVAATAFGQAAPTFEVASIKPAPPITPEAMRAGTLHLGVRVDQARADFGGMSLAALIAYAYGVKIYQVSGPDWINSERFDILAKMPEGASSGQAPEMMKALLADRFKLTLRRETKELPVLALVVAKGGLKAPPKPADYDPAAAGNKARPLTMDVVATMLSNGEQPVVDQTELAGQYLIPSDVIMSFVTSRARQAAQRAAGAARGSEEASDPGDAGVTAAAQSLGLKLEPRKVPMPYLVVERAEKSPSEN